MSLTKETKPRSIFTNFTNYYSNTNARLTEASKPEFGTSCTQYHDSELAKTKQKQSQ